MRTLPTTTQMGGHNLDITWSKETITTKDGRVVLGLFRPVTNVMIVGHPDSIGETKSGEAFVHEHIEAADAIYELKLPHQTIQTLSAALYQAFSSGEVNFAKAA